ncbi:transglutaminase N-terminal domain-containing protein [Sphingomonas sp. 179-A 2A2 NHS]|uniref:transglutaminase family protein n=1 Tax=Sphingomonas sp. 179-A 2A2 NHS TaxID=3374290 RepID=UPI0038794D11
MLDGETFTDLAVDQVVALCPMTLITIGHRTTYHYAEPVTLGPHRMMLRPRESRDVHLLSHDLVIEPAADISWTSDVAGNAIATATFSNATDTLTIDSISTVRLYADQWPVFDIAASAISYPFAYAPDERADLGALAIPGYVDDAGRLAAWTRAFILGNSTDTLSLLKDISNGIASSIFYQSREDEGTQGPLETLDRGWGSCRDLALLFVEAVRTLGIGARIVSGYLHDADGQQVGSAGAGSTHAWAEIFLPGAGWITFDPTNRSVGGFNLIPVAVARDIRQVVPVAGSFTGRGPAFLEVSVSLCAS